MKIKDFSADGNRNGMTESELFEQVNEFLKTKI